MTEAIKLVKASVIDLDFHKTLASKSQQHITKKAIEAIEKTEQPSRFPNVSWAIVQIVLKKEQIDLAKMKKLSAEADDLQTKTDLLLELSAELAKLPQDKDSHELTKEAKAIHDRLKKEGIDLFKGDETKISREKLFEIKSLIGSQVDRLKSELQTKLTTQVHPLIQMISSINECGKMIVRYSAQMLKTIIDNQKSR